MNRFELGDWQVVPDQRRIIGPGGEKRLQPKVMEVLCCLAAHQGEVVTRDQLLETVWDGRPVTDEVLFRSISVLRTSLGDDRANPRYVETIAKSGYRLIAPVSTPFKVRLEAAKESSRNPRLYGVALALGLAIIFGWFLADRAFRDDGVTPFEPPAQSVAVLPFVNISGETDNEYFSDGISEEILNILAQDPNLLVVARTSSFSFKQSKVDLPSIGRALNVAHIVEGSVRTAEDRVRVTAQLIRTSDGTHIWSETYDYSMTGIFEIQEEIGTAIATQISDVVFRDKYQVRYKPGNLDAYEAYLLGRYRLQQRTIAAFREAAGHFQQSIQYDPDYPLAYVGLADAYALLHEYGDFLTLDEMSAKTQPLLTKAITLDPALGEAYASLGALGRLQEDFDDAERAFQRAIELSPNYPRTYQQYGYLLAIQMGRAEEGLRQLRRAKELDPLSLIINKNLADALVAAGHIDEGIEQFHKVIEIDKNFPGAYQNLAATYRGALGQLDKSVLWLKQAIELDDQNPALPSVLSQTYLDLAELDQARVWRDRSSEIAMDDSQDPALAAMWLGLFEEESEAARGSANQILDAYPRHTLAQRALRILDFEAGNQTAFVARTLGAYEHVLESPEALSYVDLHGAIALAYALRLSGDVRAAMGLEDRALTLMKQRPRLGFGGFNIADARVFAIRGETDLAIEALRAAFSEGWRTRIWLIDRDPMFRSLQADDEYRTLLDEVRSDVDRMRVALMTARL